MQTVKKLHTVSERYVCNPCLENHHGDCTNAPDRWCICHRYKHEVNIRENQPVKLRTDFREKIPTKWSLPHRVLMQEFNDQNVHIDTEQEVTCDPCGDVKCHHQWVLDILVYPKIDVNVKGPHHYRGKQTLKDERRTKCLVNSGYMSIPVHWQVALNGAFFVVQTVKHITERHITTINTLT